MNKELLVQGFQWYINASDHLWVSLSEKLPFLKQLGVTGLWLPPAYKGHRGINDSGYGVYDLYDLGEFMQKGTVATKYGTKEEYLKLIQTCKENSLDVYVDIVLNHRIGADELEKFNASVMNPLNRHEMVAPVQEILSWTYFSFSGRNNVYSDFKWHYYHFKAVDYNEYTHQPGIYLIENKNWDQAVSQEYGNYDYLMGADVDFRHPEVMPEITNWLKWYYSLVQFEGVRLDALKHIDAPIIKTLLNDLRAHNDVKAIGEYWCDDLGQLNEYLAQVEESLQLFDVPLHYNLHDLSIGKTYDLRTVFDNTLVADKPDNAITFVDNHDTQKGQSLQSWIDNWFREQAYALILLRPQGSPCVFYTDLDNKKIQQMMSLRREHRDGDFVEVNDDPNTRIWGYNGEKGFVSIIAIADEGSKTINMSSARAGDEYYNINNPDITVIIDSDGNGTFPYAHQETALFLRKDVMNDFSLL